MALTMSASAIHAQTHDDPGEMLRRAAVDAARRARDDRDVHLGVLRRRRSRRAASCATPTPGIRTRSSSRRRRRSSGSPARDPPLGMAERRAGDGAPAVERRARPARAVHRRRQRRAQSRRRAARRGAGARRRCAAHRDEPPARDPRPRLRRARRSTPATRRAATTSRSSSLQQLIRARRAADARGARLPPIRKSLGQHFLTDRRILERIADALELTRRRDGRRDRAGAGRAHRHLRRARRARRSPSSSIARSRRSARALRGDAATSTIVEADVLDGRPRRARRRAVRARRQRAVLHHDADPLSRARAAARRRAPCISCSARSPSESSRDAGHEGVRRAVGERAGAWRSAETAVPRAAGRVHAAAESGERRRAHRRRAPIRSSRRTRRTRFRTLRAGRVRHAPQADAARPAIAAATVDAEAGRRDARGRRHRSRGAAGDAVARAVRGLLRCAAGSAARAALSRGSSARSDSPSSSIAMFTVFTVTSAGAWSCVGAKLSIALIAGPHDAVERPPAPPRRAR